MSEIELTDVDPFIAQRVVAIRDRFGLRGLHAAHALIEMEISIFEDQAADLSEDDDDRPTGS